WPRPAFSSRDVPGSAAHGSPTHVTTPPGALPCVRAAIALPPPVVNKRTVKLHVEPLEVRELLSASSDALLGAVYQSVFGRPLDETGRAAWGTLLDQGRSPQTVVLDILASTECHTRTVQDLYTKLLGRVAEPQGLGTFVNYLDGGGSPQQAEALV